MSGGSDRPRAAPARYPGASSARRPPLIQPAERELVTAAKAARGDGRAALIDAFRPLIGSVARMYVRSATIDEMELAQEGIVGLLRALERFDPNVGTPFWAYASWWVRQAMQQLVSELTRPVVLSDRAARHLARIKEAQQEHLRTCGTEPTPLEIASRTGLGREQVENLIAVERKPRA